MVFRDRILPFDSGVLCPRRPALWKADMCFLQYALFHDRDRGLHLAGFGRVCASWMDRAREHSVRGGVVQWYRPLVAYPKEMKSQQLDDGRCYLGQQHSRYLLICS